MPPDSNNIYGFFDEFEASEEESQLLPKELILEPVEISSTIDSLPAKIQEEVLRRIKVITFVEKRLKGGWTEKNLNPILSLVESELQLTPPSWRTVATWKKSTLKQAENHGHLFRSIRLRVIARKKRIRNP